MTMCVLCCLLGLISLPKLCKHFESFWLNVWPFIGVAEHGVQFVFLLGYHIEVSTELYRTASMMSKMKMVTKLSSVGNSSFSFHISIFDETSGQTLATMFRDMVQVNSTTRKPEPLPPAFKRKLQKVMDGFQIQPPPRLVLPSVNRESCFCCKLIVNNIDMDYNDHTTQVKYVDYTLECAAQAAASGYYKKLKRDIFSYCVSKLSILHIGESRAGDELLVMTWEDQLNPLLLYFVVTKDGKDICQAKIEFYDPYIHSNL